jgi:hypothetical protein
MTDDELKAIEERAEKASAGKAERPMRAILPWHRRAVLWLRRRTNPRLCPYCGKKMAIPLFTSEEWTALREAGTEDCLRCLYHCRDCMEPREVIFIWP